MKRLFQIGLIATVVFFSNGCDYVDAPYYVPGPNGCTTSEPTFTPRSSSDLKKKVLIEDFTGHRCGNCPDAATKLHDIMAAYPDQVVGVGEHSVRPSEFTGVYPNDVSVNPSLKYIHNFVRQAATDNDDMFSISPTGLPKGMVNRVSVSGSYSLSYSVWETHVASELAIPQSIDIQLSPSYDASDSSLCVYSYVQFLGAIDTSYKIVIYLTENHFVNWQKKYGATPSEDISTFEHNHVMRETITTNTGSLVTGGTAKSNQAFVNGFSIPLAPDKYNLNNLSIVAFVYDPATQKVIQAEEKELIP